MPRFKAVFLDVGDTLLTMGEPLAVYRDILIEHGHQVELAAVERALQAARQVTRSAVADSDQGTLRERAEARRERMVHQLLTQLGVKTRFNECRSAIRESWLGTRVFHQYPDSLPVLRALKERGYTVGAISNWEARLETLCANHGLSEYFDFILASEAEGYEKPSPVLFEKALRLAGVAPREAIHIGDSVEKDVWPAHAAGLSAVLIARSGSRDGAHSPTIHSLEQLLPLLDAGEWLRGRVESGVGQAAGFTELAWVRQQCLDRLGYVPWPGTLNIRLESAAERDALTRVKARSGLPLEPEPGYCAGRCYPVVVEGWLHAAIVIPEVSSYPDDVVELLSPVQLREALNLVDGSVITLAVTSPT